MGNIFCLLNGWCNCTKFVSTKFTWAIVIFYDISSKIETKINGKYDNNLVIQNLNRIFLVLFKNA